MNAGLVLIGSVWAPLILQCLLGPQVHPRHVVGVDDAVVDHRPVLAGHLRFADSVKEHLDFQLEEAYT